MTVCLKKTAWVFFAVFALNGCMSKPLTKNVINDIGMHDIDRFQYFISATVRLTATETIREPNIDRRGTARIQESSVRDVIIINGNTMGVLMNSWIDAGGLLNLEICFEENLADSGKRLIFRQSGPGLEQNFYIVYTDPRRRTLNYGGREYTLETKSGERISLKIKINRSRTEQERVRRVKGRRVEN